ncbi:hypothetical protein C900_02935 [Fulvivirga imtechensis AK7]|uniref:Uncharacterized protein n=1 Tax=Fulvivirga imtechensis AK7 TaxID=1237149 RepID=L8JR36_9BACT|nr:hypothetical protein C900_02935 [Fulvivirga imtechensis AK7]
MRSTTATKQKSLWQRRFEVGHWTKSDARQLKSPIDQLD